MTVLFNTKQPESIGEDHLDSTQSPQLGNFQKLTICGSRYRSDAEKLRLRMSKDGTPIFETQSKKSYIPGSSVAEDFLSAEDLSGLPWKETDRRVKHDTRTKRKDEFWERVRQAAEFDKKRWASLQETMARDKCIVDITFRGDWAEFAPKSQTPRTTWTPLVPSQSRLSPFAPIFLPQYGKKKPGARYDGNTNRPSGSSGLRNETKW